MSMTITDLWPFSLLTEIGFSLIGSPCWQNFLWLPGCTRMAPCCGTVLLYTPFPASYAHWTSSPSPWRPHWLKGLTCDPEQGWISITISYLPFLLSEKIWLEEKQTVYWVKSLAIWASDIFPCLHQETDWSSPHMFFLLMLWKFCLPKVKYKVVKPDIYSRYLRVPASGISSSPATAALLAIQFKRNTRMTKICFMSLYCHF